MEKAIFFRYMIVILIVKNKKMLTWQQCFLICAFVQLWVTVILALKSMKIMKTFFIKHCEGIEYAAYLQDSGMTCVLDKQKVSTETFKTFKMKMVPNLSLQACIILCNQLSNCIAIKHVNGHHICYMFASKKNETKRDLGSHTLTYLKGCKRGSYFLSEIKNDTIMNTSMFFISIDVQEEEATYIVENRATIESIWGKTVLISRHGSLVSCLVACTGQDKKRGCNAVIYNPTTMKCILLKTETVSPPVSFKWNAEKHLFLLHLTVPWDLKVNSVLISTSHNITYELIAKSRATAHPEAIRHPRTNQMGQILTEAFVQLYRFMEVCKVNVIHNGIIKNVTSIQIMANVRSVNRCLHFCRPILHQLFYCAIIYSRHNYKCELLKRSTERSNVYLVDSGNNLVELVNCYPDRQDERRNNPPPIQYYLKEIGEICVLEFYNSTQLSAFNPIETLENEKEKMFTQYYLLIGLLAQLWQCKGTLFSAYLNDAQMTCVLDKRKVTTTSLQPYAMRAVFGKSFQKCILICNLLRSENKCSAIKYFQNTDKCYLFATKINSTTAETPHGSYNVMFVYGCKQGKLYLHQIATHPMLVFGGTFTSLKVEIVNKTLIIERRPTIDSIRSTIIENDRKTSTADCVVTCYAKSWHTGCNAVIYNNRTSFCTLLKHETPTPPITFTHHEMTLMLLLHLTLPWDVKVNSVAIKTTHNISYELISESRATIDFEKISGASTKQVERTSTEAYVHLHRYMEVCKVNVIHNGIIENVTSIEIIANVRSVNRCLHFCRPILHQLFYCAIIYSRHNYKCELLKRNTERSSAYFVDGENNLMELLNCYPDRQSLRINNPLPLQYYLKETGEICVLEFYNATQLRGFYPIETLENVENLKSCIYACRLRYYSCICLAINYTMKKQCILLRKEPNYGIYNVEHRSIFGEMLFCEPGTLE
ncbi:hypothetical protein T4A_11472 [Trichinella pseudospiralis]|uniref:Apple domain-containing protein n=1 Tax=Trichinella pseudospiralis TaxID=6337 RepID=A0A0V1EV55_TRIPS|nr:hypothetical protein T4A_11472 [Trichinella pseudospiralis]